MNLALRYIQTGNTQGHLTIDDLGRFRSFIGNIKGISGVWIKEYRKQIPVKVYEEMVFLSEDDIDSVNIMNPEYEWIYTNNQNRLYRTSVVNND